MTNEELLAKIKAEIERRKKENQKSEKVEDSGAFYEDCALLSFLDTLESEKPMEEGLEEEISRTYHDGSVTNTSDLDHVSYENIARHFAQWGADHTPLPEDTVLFNKGVEEGKRLMMEEAVEGEVMTNGFYPYEPRIVAPYPNCPYDFGDKVRVIVLPKED